MSNKENRKTMGTLRKNASLESILDSIHYGDLLKKDCGQYIVSKGFQYMCVDISAAEFYTDIRYQVQKVYIPEDKKGNLSIFAGKNVEVIVSNIAWNGPRIEFWIRKAK